MTGAQQALERGSWDEARIRFAEALIAEETPEALEGLGAAAWWLEDPQVVFASRERAYRLYRERGDRRSAGRLATQIGYDYAVFRAEAAVCSGWLQRAHRLLDGLAPVPEQAVLALVEAELAYYGDGDLEQIRRLAVRAKDLAGDLGLFNLEMVGLAIEGLAMVGLGEVPDGMRRLDEATAAAVAGDIEDVQSVAATMCVMIFACERVQDVDRPASGATVIWPSASARDCVHSCRSAASSTPRCSSPGVAGPKRRASSRRPWTGSTPGRPGPCWRWSGWANCDVGRVDLRRQRST